MIILFKCTYKIIIIIIIRNVVFVQLEIRNYFSYVDYKHYKVETSFIIKVIRHRKVAFQY